ncbi:lithocholate 6-beta-hydroxylase [Trichonephila clavipes]|nr:lithocholate 6-beta-hydroxylase [Trichonephila clavipes]
MTACETICFVSKLFLPRYASCAALERSWTPHILYTVRLCARRFSPCVTLEKVWYSSRNDDYWKKRGIPYIPRASTFYMFYIISRKNIADLVKDVTKNFGRVVGSFQGSEPTVTITDPNVLRDIFVKDFHVFPYRRIMKTYDPIADAMVSLMVGEDWKRVRTIITPAFTSKRMRQV